MHTASTQSLVLLAFLLLTGPAPAATYWVAPTGSDGASGTAPGNAWKTLQHAANQVGPGDTVIALAGTYAGFNLFASGAPGAPITFRADPSGGAPNPAVVVNQNNGFTNKDRINLEGASHVVLEGFTVQGSGDPATSRACIRTVGLPGNHAAFVTIRGNRCQGGGRWGVLTGFVDDLLIENNVAADAAAEHGIYVSNSGDRPIVRDNLIFDNHSNGLHMNGDASLGGDGIISQALVERNVIHGNGDGDPQFGPPGGSAINCDGVRNSLIRNNLLFDNHKSGISLYRIDGGAPSSNNVVVNNTVHNAADARWALNIQDASTGNVVRNNVLLNDHPFRGALDISSDSLPGLVSDHNAVKDRFGLGGAFISLAEWQVATGQDLNSFVTTPAAVFAGVAQADYRLFAGSPSVDAGTALSAPPDDLYGKPRPALAGYDIGSHEYGACHGDVAHYGQGGVLQLALAGCPDPGDEVVLSIQNGPPGGPGLILLGSQPASIPALGGIILVNPTVVVPVALNAQGAFTAAFGIPDLPALSGSTAYLQALAATPGPGGTIVMSDGIAVTIG